MYLDTSQRKIMPFILALLVSCMAFQLNCSMLSPVLVTMAEELRTDEASIGLSQTSFFTSAALFSLFLPRLSDIVGRKRIMIIMLGVMLAGTVMSAMARNTEMLFTGRIIQGVCGPVVAICLMTLKSRIKDARQCGLLMGIITAVNGGIAGVDAILGGELAQHFGFRAVFWCIAIVTVIAIICVLLFSEEFCPSPDVRMDWRGTAFLVAGLGSFLLVLSEASKMDGSSLQFCIVLLIFSIICLVTFWFSQKKAEYPLVQIRYLKRRSTWALLLTTSLTMCGGFAIINGLIVSYVQNAQVGFGKSADWAGMFLLMPYALAGWFMGPFAGRFAPVIGYTNMLRLGLLGSIAAFILIIMIGVNSLPVLIICLIFTGATYAGIANIILNVLGVVLSPADNQGFLPGLNAGAFNLGAGLSFAVLPSFQHFITQGTSLTQSGYQSAMGLGAVITILAFITACFIPKPTLSETSLASRSEDSH